MYFEVHSIRGALHDIGPEHAKSLVTLLKARIRSLQSEMALALTTSTFYASGEEETALLAPHLAGNRRKTLNWLATVPKLSDKYVDMLAGDLLSRTGGGSGADDDYALERLRHHSEEKWRKTCTALINRSEAAAMLRAIAARQLCDDRQAPADLNEKIASILTESKTPGTREGRLMLAFRKRDAAACARTLAELLAKGTPGQKALSACHLAAQPGLSDEAAKLMPESLSDPMLCARYGKILLDQLKGNNPAVYTRVMAAWLTGKNEDRCMQAVKSALSVKDPKTHPPEIVAALTELVASAGQSSRCAMHAGNILMSIDKKLYNKAWWDRLRACKTGGQIRTTISRGRLKWSEAGPVILEMLMKGAFDARPDYERKGIVQDLFNHDKTSYRTLAEKWIESGTAEQKKMISSYLRGQAGLAQQAAFALNRRKKWDAGDKALYGGLKTQHKDIARTVDPKDK